MPARTLNDFFAGFFYGRIKADLEVKMVIPSRNSKKIKVEGERDKEKEVILRYRIVPPKWKTWNDEDFSWEWNKTYLTHKREINPK